MKCGAFLLAACFLCPSSGLALARYVDVSSPNPSAPFTNWVTAAKVLQDAVDLSVAGDLVLVADGIYETGGRPVGFLTNRVAIQRAVTVRSVNGPEFTLICGSPDPSSFFGDSAVSCAFLEDAGARLEGFTLTNGATRARGMFDAEMWYGGGAFCFSGTLSNCVITGNSAAADGGGVCGGTLVSCLLSNNVAYWSGGGASVYSGAGGGSCVLRGCEVINNSAANSGGGAYCQQATDTKFIGNQAWQGGGASGPGGSGSFLRCTFEGNRAGNNGGGAAYNYGASVNVMRDCIFLNNSAGGYGGGAYGCNLEACRFSSNSASYGGGVSECTLQNCLLIGNHGAYGGGVAAEPQPSDPISSVNVLRNCTVAFNTADTAGGGVLWVAAFNSIIFYNTASQEPNCSGSTNVFCCTTPLPSNGSNNIATPPGFVDAAAGKFQLQSNSPCIDAGANAFVRASVDIDGKTRILGGTVDLGAFESSYPVLSPFQLWLQSYGLPVDGSADYIDSDQDGLNNADEWVCSTNPTNRLSVLQMLSPARSGSGWTVSWKSVAGVRYTLERALGDERVPQFVALATNITGSGGITTYVDTNDFTSAPVFFRAGVAR